MHQVMTSRQEFCYARVKEAKASSVSWLDYSKTDRLFASLQAYYIKVNFQGSKRTGGSRTFGDRPRQP
jgi:hypothetical protein